MSRRVLVARHTALVRGAVSGAVLAASGAMIAGCSTLATDCDKILCASAAAGTGTGTGTGTGAGGTCDPTAAPADGGCIDESRGVFVRTEGDDANPGTREAPVATIGKAVELAVAEGKAVMACAQSFDEGVTLLGGVHLYGGLDCASDWRHGSGKTTVAPTTAGVVPLTLAQSMTMGAVSRLEDVIAMAPATSAPGGSSIAVIADRASARIARSELVAGNAAAGLDGSDAPVVAAAAGTMGNAGQSGICDNPGVRMGGAALSNAMCTSSVGGKGGNSDASIAQAGDAGLPMGLGGIGCAANSCNCSGRNGLTGPGGMTGLGAVGIGSISALGFQGAPGDDGADGQPGGGGGGGGARSNLTVTQCQFYANGPPGGGGGSGGCGGLGGGGGRAAGSSVAIVSIESSLELDDVVLRTGTGGDGGDGGLGQTGGMGGLGGLGGVLFAAPSCGGGAGGPGGRGGDGGGGQGGHSLGIAHTGTAPVETAVTYELGSPGIGGGMQPPDRGADGVGAEKQTF